VSINSAVRHWLLGGAAALWFAAAPLGAGAETGPVLRVGDHVLVTVFNHPDLSGDHVVDSDGTITVPLIGAIPAVGKQTSVLAHRIESTLHTYLPFATVQVARETEGAAITVAGWPFPVAAGTLAYVPGQTLLGTIALIRNAPQFGSPVVFDPYHSKINMRSVSVLRDAEVLGPYDVIKFAAAGESGPILHPGDTIRFINKPIEVTVYGAVKQPGFAYLDRDEPLADAIDQVGGFADNAMTAEIAVNDGQATTLTSIGERAFHEPLAADATVTVPAAPQVTVGGIVLHPGIVVLKSDRSLLAAVFDAGGPDKFGDLGHVSVIHHGVSKLYDVTKVTVGNTAQNPELVDGDQVYVPHGRQMDNTILASLMASLRWLVFP
jgi:polysaccharide export outer membrane protein